MISNLVHIKFIKRILKKPVKDRTEEEQDKLIDDMLEIQYFK